MRGKLKMEQRGCLFAWPVATAHAWVEDYQVNWEIKTPEEVMRGREDQPPWLLEFGRYDWYTPLSKPTLHRKFGKLEPEAGPIVKFANKHGLLGFPVALYAMGKDGRGKVAYAEASGESQWRWKHEIDTMALWLGIWDLIQQKQAGKLGRIIKWPRPDRVLLDVAPRREQGTFEVRPRVGDDPPYLMKEVADIHNPGEAGLFERWRMGDVLEPARYALHCQINEKLRERVYLHLAWPHFESFEHFMMPKSLLSAMWLMFMWEVIGATAVLRCPVCGEWVERSNANQKTCSAACKQRRYRERQRVEVKEAQHERVYTSKE